MIEIVDEGSSNNGNGNVSGNGSGTATTGTRSTARDRTAQAIHYYNNNVLKARTGSNRISPYDYLQQQQQSFRGGGGGVIGSASSASSSYPNTRLDNLYRSNSSLELLHDANLNEYHRGYGGCGGGVRSGLVVGTGIGSGCGGDVAYRTRNGAGGCDIDGGGGGGNATYSSLKREYGSHGSIDVISIVDQRKRGTEKAGDQFFSMLQEYKPAVFDLIENNRRTDRKSTEYYDVIDGGNVSRTKSEIHQNTSNVYSTLSSVIGGGVASSSSSTRLVQDENNVSSKITSSTNSGVIAVATSPKPKSKFHKFWSSSTVNMGSGSKNDAVETNVTTTSSSSSSATTLATINGNNVNATATQQHQNYTNVSMVGGLTNGGAVVVDPSDEKQRRQAFAYYDCQSLIAKLGYGGRVRSLLSKRRNTTTGASAASMIGARSTTPDGDTNEEDAGDGRSNDLIESCPFFRNEMGGEEERVVSLTRSYSPAHSKHWKDPYHRPPLACGISILEYPLEETHWKGGTCPYRRDSKAIENVDEGALYYRKYFYKQEHQNWFGTDDTLGPVAISIKREKVDAAVTQSENGSNGNGVTQLGRYRLIVRTSELQTLRGSVLEDAIPNLKSSHNGKYINTKEVFEYVIPEIQLSCLRLGISTPHVEEQLLNLDEQRISRHYKIGILYCKAGQATEEEMYNNEEGGPAFNEFLETIGQKVRLKGFDKYKAGLDNKSDSTGLYSVYAQYKDCEIMFHVSTMLPFTPNNRQQLLRKRHIGNDIVTIVFQEPGAQPFTPKNIRSQFQHVFIVVRVVNPCSDCTQYRIAVTRSKDVELFGPPIPKGATLNKSKNFADFLLAKVINGENAAHCSDKFATMATRTRQAYLYDLTTNCTSSTLLENSQKFSIISFSSKKKERWKPRIVHDTTQRGAICWHVKLEDSTQSINIHCYLAISTDSLVLIDENTNGIVFVTPCKSILGWSTQTNSLRVYYHEGECVTMHMRESNDRDELMEVVSRLKSVTPGSPAIELSLKRNAVGQLGFHVQPDGVVTQVENMGHAWHAGLRQGARLVEICKVAVATLTHDQMVDLLKTSLMVTVTVIPSLPDGTARRGCSVPNCKYDSINEKAGYDNCSSLEDQKLLALNTASLQQPVIGKHKKMYERSLSPPRSSSSSGYGTGSSNKSFGAGVNSGKNSGIYNNGETLLNSLSSGQSNEDSWYDILETDSMPSSLRNNMSPPPLPARVPSAANANGTRSSYKYSPHSKGKLNAVSMSSSNMSYSLPVVLDNDVDLEYTKHRSEFITGEKVTCLMKAERSHKVRKQLEQKMPISGLKNDDYGSKSETSVNLPSDNLKTLSLNDGHSTDTSSTSEKAFPPSEDELSVESNGNASPKLRSSAVRSATSNSSNGSRNNSPRMRDLGEIRLRPGASARSSNRNSANFTSSTLQQDLMKLINPDENQTPEDDPKSGHNLPYVNILNDVSTENTYESAKLCKSKSKENIQLIQKNANNDDKVIVTTARPATVISNMTKEERLSLRATNISNSKHEPVCLPATDVKDLDWTSLIETATKAMQLQQLSSNEENHSSLVSSMSDNDFQWVDSSNEFHFSMAPGTETKKSVQQRFQKYLSELENRLMKETQRRLTLEKEVHSLRDENRRLQQESQSAAQQLRRFTEWFFQTIDKQ